MKEAVFLQVRLQSTRLPRKALLPLAGEPAVVHTMRALKSVDVDQWVLVTDKDSEQVLAPLAEAEGFSLFAGDAVDVLRRYCVAAEKFGIDRIVRATGDNPLTSGSMANRSLELSREHDADYAGILDIPYGSGVEVLSTGAIVAAMEETSERYDHEHVSPFILRNGERFHVVRRIAPDGYRYPELRVTLDTAADYHQLAEFFANLYHGRPIELDELVAYAIGRQKQVSA